MLFLGRPNRVVGMAGRLLKTHLPVDDNGMMILRYPNAMCRLEMTWTEAVPNKPPHDLMLHGTEGTIIAGSEVVLYTRVIVKTAKQLRQMHCPKGKIMPPNILFIVFNLPHRPVL